MPGERGQPNERLPDGEEDFAAGSHLGSGVGQRRLTSFEGDREKKPEFFTVTEINNKLKQLIEARPEFRDIWVKGEISNFRIYPSGAYFTLKDTGAEIPAVMWKMQLRALRFDPKEGDKVLVRAEVAVYAVKGKYQLSVSEMRPEGLGELFLKYKALYAKLEAEGLFAEGRKRPLPPIPVTVGIVTAKKGAAIQDMLRTIAKRRPSTKVVLKSVRVQGEGAADEIAEAIGLFNARCPVDVLIVGRGGGSIEDLWPFNEEVVARAIAASTIPVISAVGHESDFTIADFVADRRAPTPTGAAQMAVPDDEELARRVAAAEGHLSTALAGAIGVSRERLEGMMRRPAMRRPQARVMEARQRVDEVCGRLAYAGRMREENAEARLSKASHVLESLSPLKTLARGYSILIDDGGRPVTSVESVDTGDALTVRLQDGELDTSVLGRRRLN